MRISVRQLRRIIKESIAVNRLTEGADPMTVEAVINKFTSDKMTWSRFARNDFYHMAEGGNLGGERSKYYPDWADEDFQTVIAAVDGSYDP